MAPGQAHHSNVADALCSAHDEDNDGDGDGWPAPLASTISTTGQQHWPPPLVSTTGRQHWPGPLAACYKHISNDDANDVDDDDNGDDDDNDYDADYAFDYDDDDDDDDGDGDDCGRDVCVLVCVCCVCVRAEQNHRAAPLPAPLASIITTSGQHHWPTPLTSRIDVKYWIGCMIQPENQETQKCSTI